MIPVIPCQKYSEAHPLLVVYGDYASFTERSNEFRHALKNVSTGSYLDLDMLSAQRGTWPATLVEILVQIGEAVLRTVPVSEESMQLQVYKRLHLLQNLQRRTCDDAPDEQLVQCLDFAELILYPMLTALWQAGPSVTLSMLHVEEILHWGREFQNFLMESLLRHFLHGSVQVVLYVKQSEKPRAFFGSNEMYTSKQVGFYCLDDGVQ